MQVSALSLWGAGAFGLVIGWIAYRTLRRSQGSRVGDLVTVIAALGGGAVVDTRFADPELFATYGFGLASGFFGYFAVAFWVDRSERKADERSALAEAGRAPAEAPVPSQVGSRPGDWMGDGVRET
ncbi:hypothetical protein [Streptomyces zaehneri]|uniref:hypothetical protein n=1 Tax=Streptomyces zaehneri TaxID=3051180 RepID=UPI0028D435CE|nr:hypothetical protein [Streptomyces sp. DSM 40713]